MPEVHLTDLKKMLNGELLFSAATLSAHTGERVGIVGANGAGKSTLARILIGVDQDFEGRIVVPESVQYVPQIAPTAAKSGGQSMVARVRTALASQPQLLILDEPSANLDEPHQRWLQQQLLHYPGILLLIAHDRQLLNAVTTKTWAVRQHQFISFSGNYAAYAAHQAAQDEAARQAVTREHHQLQQLKLAAEKRRQKAAKVRKGSRSMGAIERKQTKSLRELTAGKLERSAKAMLERGAKQLTASAPPAAKGVKLVAVDLPPVTGKYLLRVADLTLRRGGRVLIEQAQLDLRPGERLALTGPNGSGKSTLIEAIMNQQPGVTLAASTRVGYFHQDLLSLPLAATVANFMGRASALDPERTRRLMGAFGLSARFYPQAIGSLSGGEQVKLQLLSVLLAKANLLILDEPTNYLDLPAMQALERFLRQYPGTVLFVSHDEALRQAVATRSLMIEKRRLVDPALKLRDERLLDLVSLQHQYDQLMLATELDVAELRRLRALMVQANQR